MSLQPNNEILSLMGVCKSFAKDTGSALPVLENVSISLHSGEILGLLGRSGAGKSTVLRIAGGLIKADSGQVKYEDKPLEGPAEGIAIVFQSFALLPWLTVQDNVEAGLDALGVSREEKHRRAEQAIDLIGLDGFQSAYPRELSGGMRQRVGFARAMVVDPKVLLMDEPFSALDVLTAEMLRTDFIDLWAARKLSVQSALLVTHNIEEAVLMCDRIIVLASKPGRVAAEIHVPLAHPRNRLDEGFRSIVDELYATLTSRMAQSIQAHRQLHGGRAQPLPQASISRIIGLAETLATEAYGGHAELAKITQASLMSVNDLFSAAEALHLLEFAELKEGAISLTAAGRVFADSNADERKQLFREHLLKFVPLAAHIRRILDERDEHRAPRVRFEPELEDHLSEDEAEKTLQVIISWGRYAELFSYDDSTRSFC